MFVVDLHVRLFRLLVTDLLVCFTVNSPGLVICVFCGQVPFLSDLLRFLCLCICLLASFCPSLLLPLLVSVLAFFLHAVCLLVRSVIFISCFFIPLASVVRGKGREPDITLCLCICLFASFCPSLLLSLLVSVLACFLHAVYL